MFDDSSSQSGSAAPASLDGDRPTVDEVAAVLARLFPPSLAESWDNTGLLLGDGSRRVSRLTTCLTLTPDVADEALATDTSLIVSHHPILFGGVKRLTTAEPDSAALLKLAGQGIAVYSPHTSFDSASEGINAWLAERLGLESVVPIQPSESEAAIGTGRIGKLAKPVPLERLADRLCAVAKIEGTHLIASQPPSAVVSTVAIACGAAGSLLTEAIRVGAEVFLTGEMRFHDCLAARARGVSVLLPGHYATERPAVEWLAGRLAEELPEVTCVPSEVECDPLRWYAPATLSTA